MTNTKTFRNANWTKRDHECTNVVACVAPVAPAGNWVESDDSILSGLTRLWIQAGVEYYGHM